MAWYMDRFSLSFMKMLAREKAHMFCLDSTPCSMCPIATSTSARSSPNCTPQRMRVVMMMMMMMMVHVAHRYQHLRAVQPQLRCRPDQEESVVMMVNHHHNH
jgi:hypothetical protein